MILTVESYNLLVSYFFVCYSCLFMKRVYLTFFFAAKQNKDEEYTRNQRQNISDAITLLPRLATGLDVNVRFRK